MAASLIYDLSAVELTPGEHTFRAKARDNSGGHSDSAFSNTVSFTKLFPVQINLNNAEASEENPESMENNTTWLVKFEFTADEGYRFAEDSVTVTGANISVWNKDLGQLFLNYATGNVTIIVSAEEIPPKIPTPVISVGNDTLTWDAQTGVVRYDVYVDGTRKGYVDPDNVWHAAN